ncbi:MAG: DUF5063 domain-containing protein [Muribaculaceae bacterium]|nr:DUF5063 domain-containing protein [Muribaculaceae bacterium]
MTNNALAFTALCNEYCAAAEHASTTEPADFVSGMLRLLPRIYISAFDLADEGALDDGYIEQRLDEDTYNSLRHSIQVVLGEDDTYLEVFEEDMKYSDSPIGASLSEGLADLFQVFYNYLETVRDATDDVIASALVAVKEDFDIFWSATLCNVLRPLNSIHFRNERL